MAGEILLKEIGGDSVETVEITITEGKNHQVKNMFKEVGYEVLKLKREKLYFFTIDNLKSGDYRKLTPKEVSRVYNIKNK